MGRGFGKGERCTYCSRVMEGSVSPSTVRATWDHIHPKCLGGRQKVLCCWKCNQAKGNATWGKWAIFMAQNPKWWKMGPISITKAWRELMVLSWEMGGEDERAEEPRRDHDGREVGQGAEA